MKRFISYIIIFCISLFVLPLNSCKDYKKEAETALHTKYTCPMHPQIIKDAPGSCPICGMDLVPLTATASKQQLVLSESQIALANVKTQKINTGNFTASKILNGRVVANPEATEQVSSKFPGRIDKLFIKEIGVQVSAGQPLFQIYSEELQTLQQDYLLQVKQERAFPGEKIYKTLKEAARNKLKLFGYSNAQIVTLEKNSKMSPLITIYSKASGVVQEIAVTEGQYVAEGSPIIRLENFNSLWVEADIYPSEANVLKVGSSVKVSVEGTPEQAARISFISPALEASTQLLKARINISNTGNLQPGMRATISLPTAQISNAVSLPVDAVIRDEDGAYAWVKTGKETFEPRKVSTGQEDENQIIITSGLEGTKEVVISGSYLLNSELELKGKQGN